MSTARDALDDAIARGDLVAALQAIEREHRYLPREELEGLAARLEVPSARLYGVASFYAGFHFSPRGRQILRVCHGTACHVRGAPRITAALAKHLDIEPGATTEDLEYTLDSVACIGCCSLAPVMVVGERTCGRLDAAEAVRALDPE